jgi:hypothetical protein
VTPSTSSWKDIKMLKPISYIIDFGFEICRHAKPHITHLRTPEIAVSIKISQGVLFLFRHCSVWPYWAPFSHFSATQTGGGISFLRPVL